jgi:hypothetical protein
MTLAKSIWSAVVWVWHGLHPYVQATVMGLLLGAGCIGVVMVPTLTAFDWWDERTRVLIAWPFVSSICGIAYYVEGPQVYKRLFDKL